MSFSKKFKTYSFCFFLLFLFIPSKARPETLREALQLAWQTNPQLQASRQSFFSASTDVQTAFADWLPQADLSMNYGINQSLNELNQPNAQGDRETRSSRNPWSASLAVTQNIFRGGQIISQFKQSKSLREAAYGDLLTAEQNILLSAVTAYFNLLRDDAIVRLNRNKISIFRERLLETRNRLRVGEGTRTLVAFAEARLSGSRTELASADAQYIASRAAYRRIIGREPGKLIFPDLPSVPRTEKQAQALAHQNHPALIASQERYEVARLAKIAAYGLFLPNVSVEGLYQQGEELSNATKKTTNLSVTGRVRLPLFRGGASFATVRKAAHEAERARFGLLDQRRQIDEAVANAWQSIQRARAQVASASDEVRARRIALAGVRQEQSLGTSTFLDSLDAEQDYLNARVSLATARRDEHVVAYNLLAATGLLTAARLKLQKGGK